ncbi:HIT domain-containing protein [bacterium]|nr:HIT domain-containing protein [bacterium]
MQRLFTPWRLDFIKNNPHKRKNHSCIFCGIIEDDSKNDAQNLVLHRGEHSLIILNKFPYSCGHTMVIPYQHGDDYLALSQDCHYEMQDFIAQSIKALKNKSSMDGCNMGMNMGKAGGAGIPQHLHYHVVPRWVGDSNFMPIIGETRVLPETLEQTYQKLKPEF